MGRSPAALALACLVATAAAAEEPRVAIAPSTSFAAGFGYAHPLGPSATFTLLRGMGADVREEDGRVRVVCAAPIRYCNGGLLVETAAGTTGGRVSVGMAARTRVDEPRFHGRFGAALKASVVRTWGAHGTTPAGLTYLGPELALQAMHVDVGLGVLTRVAGRRGGAVMLSWGVGLTFGR
jgi:hypothetical protein